MTDETTLSIGLVWAFLSNVPSYIVVVLRILVALVTAWLAWIVSPPVVRVLFKLAFQKPAPPRLVTASRVFLALAAGILMFWLFPLALGYGSGGGGTGGGEGPGVGPGKGGGKGNGSGTADSGKPKDKVIKVPGRKVIDIELTRSKDYKIDSGRWYHVEKRKEPWKFDEVEGFFKRNKGEFDEVDIIIYKDSPDSEHYAVKALVKLAEQYKLRHYIPTKYHEMLKPNGPK